MGRHVFASSMMPMVEYRVLSPNGQRPILALSLRGPLNRLGVLLLEIRFVMNSYEQKQSSPILHALAAKLCAKAYLMTYSWMRDAMVIEKFEEDRTDRKRRTQKPDEINLGAYSPKGDVFTSVASFLTWRRAT